MTIRTALALAGVVALAATATFPVLADDETDSRPPARILSDRWGIGVGGILADFDTSAVVSAGTVVGGVIRLESDLGLEDDKSTFRIDGFYRFNPRHSLVGSYFGLSRDGSSILDARIEFMDEDGETVVFDVGADVETEFGTRNFKVTYRYSFVNDGRTEAGFTAGFSTYKFDLKIAGDATVDDGTGGEDIVFDEASQDILAPVPGIGLFVTYAFRPNLVLRMYAEFVDLQISGYSGRVVDTAVTLDYFVSRHVGIGIGTNVVDIDVSRSGDLPFNVRYKQSSATWYVGFVF